MLRPPGQVEHATASEIIIVAHAHLFRAFFKRFVHPVFFHHNHELAMRLQSASVPNGTVLDVEIDFSSAPFVVKSVKEIEIVSRDVPPAAAAAIAAANAAASATSPAARGSTSGAKLKAAAAPIKLKTQSA